jgi:hypothetical protein
MTAFPAPGVSGALRFMRPRAIRRGGGMALRAILVLGAFAAMFWPSSARADDETGVLLVSSHKKFESPERFTLEVRFGLYHPRVDADPGLNGATPYRSTFGDTANFEIAAEFDWQAYRIPHFGTIGPGFGAGYTSASALAPLVTPQPDGNKLSAENTSLTIFPMYGVVVLRADVIDRELHVPFVPYAKLGVGWGLWRASNSAGTSNASGRVGEGTSLGIHAALGLALDLNVLDRAAARGFDNSMGVNHTYAFFEAFWSDLNGFGQANALNVGAYTWAAGLALSF